MRSIGGRYAGLMREMVRRKRLYGSLPVDTDERLQDILWGRDDAPDWVLAALSAMGLPWRADSDSGRAGTGPLAGRLPAPARRRVPAACPTGRPGTRIWGLPSGVLPSAALPR
jgi:hypothetical protein